MSDPLVVIDLCCGGDGATFGFMAGRTAARPGVGGPRRKVGLAEERRIMSMPWATKRQIHEAVPPVYAEWIGRHLDFVRGSHA